MWNEGEQSTRSLSFACLSFPLRFPSLRSIIVVYCNEKELNKRGKTNEERMRDFILNEVERNMMGSDANGTQILL